MCDVLGEPSDASWDTDRKARKRWSCETCRFPIEPGTVYREMRYLHDGLWSTDRVHVECAAIAEYVALDVCRNHAWSPSVDIPHEIEEHDDPRLIADWAAIVAKYGATP